jgi:hypothetical protein
MNSHSMRRYIISTFEAGSFYNLRIDNKSLSSFEADEAQDTKRQSLTNVAYNFA